MSLSREGYYETPFQYGLHYKLTGFGDERIFFVMGFSGDKRYWDPLPETIHARFPGRFTTCVYDQRGVGQSTDCVWERNTTTTLARDALGLILHLGWIEKNKPIHLVGWSLGGFACTELLSAIVRATGGVLNIASVAYCNSGHKFTLPTTHGMIHGSLTFWKGLLDIVLMRRPLSVIPHILELHYSKQYLADNFERLRRTYKFYRSPFDVEAYKVALSVLGHLKAVLTHYVSQARLDEISMHGLPTHVFVALDDNLIHPTQSFTLARRLCCKSTHLPGGHMSHMENTREVIEKLVALWDNALAARYPYLSKPATSASGYQSASSSSPMERYGRSSPSTYSSIPAGSPASNAAGILRLPLSGPGEENLNSSMIDPGSPVSVGMVRSQTFHAMVNSGFMSYHKPGLLNGDATVSGAVGVVAERHPSGDDYTAMVVILKKILLEMEPSRFSIKGINKLLHRLVSGPGRLVTFPLMILPLLVIQARRLILAKSLLGKSGEFFVFAYVMALIYIVQEYARKDG